MYCFDGGPLSCIVAVLYMQKRCGGKDIPNYLSRLQLFYNPCAMLPRFSHIIPVCVFNAHSEAVRLSPKFIGSGFVDRREIGGKNGSNFVQSLLEITDLG